MSVAPRAALLAVTVAAVAIVAVAAWQDRGRDERASAFERARDRVTEDWLSASVERQREALAETARRLELPQRPDSGVATELAAVHRLDHLECRADGVVVSAFPWVERAGLPAGSPPADPTPRARRIEQAEGAVRLLALDRAIADHECTLGRALAVPSGASLAAVRLVVDDVEPDEPPLDAEARREIGAGALRAEVIYAATPRPVEVWPTAGVAALVLLPLAACVGWLFGRAVERPTRALAAAIDAVARGEADYDFDGVEREALGSYAALFSRWDRAIARQRERARQAERVAAWREVARGVAHEVKNPLVPIRLTMQNLLRARERGPRVFDPMFERGAATVLEEVERLDRLVGEFSRFARLPEPRPRDFDPRELVRETAALFEGVVCELDGAPERIVADRDQIAQVLHNLIGNAVDAGERVAVGLSADGEDVLLSVADDGPGVPSDQAERIFEPYVTGKRQGTGLGLAITRRIVAAHGGTIELAETDGPGARFVARWPRES